MRLRLSGARVGERGSAYLIVFCCCDTPGVSQVRRLRRKALADTLAQMSARDRASLLQGLTALAALLVDEADGHAVPARD